MPMNPSPDPKRSLWDFIAYYVRFMRVQRGVKGDAMGRIISASASTVSKIENRHQRLDEDQALSIDNEWNTGRLFELLVWYASIGHDPTWFQQRVGFEQQAKAVKVYAADVIPALVQTEEYARALFAEGGEPDIEHALELRMARQEVLNKPDRPFLSILVSQNALEWPVGSPEIMRAQLARLLEVSESPRTVVRVVPRTWETGAHRGLDGSFVLFAGDDFGEVGFSNAPGAGRLISVPSEVRSFVVRYDQISGKALNESQSRSLIRKIMEAFE